MMVFGPAVVLLSSCASSYRQELARFQQATQPTSGMIRQVPAAEKMETAPDVSSIRQLVAEQRRKWEASATDLQIADDESKALMQKRMADLKTEVSLEVLLELTEALNPEILAAREAYKATIQQYGQATQLETILNQYNAFTKQLDTKVGPQQHKQMMAMKAPTPDSMSLKGEIVSTDVAIAEEGLAIARRDAANRMKVAYYDWLYVAASIEINQQVQSLLEQIIEVAQSKIKTDKATYSSVIMAQVELAKLEDRIITLEAKRDTLRARINTLLGRAPEALLGTPSALMDQKLVPALDALYELVVTQRQELKQQRLRISRMEQMLKLGKTMTYPDASMGQSYLEDRAMVPSGTEEKTFQPIRALPTRNTAFFGYRDAYLKELEGRIASMRRKLDGMELESRQQVKEAWFALDTSWRSIELYQQSLLPQAEQSLAAAEAAYRSGSLAFISFLDAERTLLTFKLELERAWRDFREAQARLDQLAGKPITRNSMARNSIDGDEPEDEN